MLLFFTLLAIWLHFDAQSVTLCVLEVLNDFRAVFFGVSFGDQG